ncbi:MAG TPA: hypothetical protein DCO68_11935 [Methylophilaceae bacterium]|nr:hypothetical protein [Methylophilaceae bacterium]HAJ72775.1 hypothetical protein [Methylophilaceae bacterium]
MARTYTVKMKQDAFPLRVALQAAIKALGYPLTLEDDYVPFASSGYLPCTLDGEDAGLIIRFIGSEDITNQNASISLQWSGDAREKATVMIVATALAASFEATVLDETNVELTFAELAARTKKVLASISEFI